MKPSQDEVKEWLQKASLDLFSAKVLLEHDPPVPETAAFHCQQAVEKTLKALLVWVNVPFEKVHSLTYLLDLGEVEFPDLTFLRERVEELAPYAVEIRYPGGIPEISPDEAEQALDTAEAAWRFALVPVGGSKPTVCSNDFSRLTSPKTTKVVTTNCRTIYAAMY